MNTGLRLQIAMLVAFALLVPGLSLCSAQDVLPFPAGTRLRVTVSRPSPQTRIARFEALTDSTLVLSPDAAPRILALADISRIERSQGRKLSLLGGALGLLVGVAAGAAVACDANRDSYGVFCGGQNDTKVVTGAVLGGVALGSGGALLFRRDHWIAVDPASLKSRR